MKKAYLVLVMGMILGLTQVSQAQFSVLLVNDNANGTERYLEIDTTLNNLGISHVVYNTVETGDYPDLSVLSLYNVVIWYTGNDGVDLKLWDLTNPDDYKFNPPLIEYLDNGGIVWLQGLDFFYDILGSAPDYFVPGQFIYDYLGVATYFAQSYADDGGVGLPELDVVEGNELCTFTPVEWVYPTLWYADALELTATSQPIYRMGPQGYVFEDYYSGVYNVFGDSKVFTLAVETARIDTEAHTDTLFSQVLSYFESICPGGIPVTDVTVSGEGGATSIDVNGGTLQMMAEVLPPNATNPTVFWSVINETGMASIDQTGLLQATGTTPGNGTVWVKALAVDGSGVADSIQITITNQGADFEILLVNDNDFGPDRYRELDTTLSNLGCAYDIYNTAVTNDIPDEDYLSYYEMVIWYTGNDGVNLKLWDVSDTNNYKFNEPLINYLDNGGIVWLQGLDFLYDIYGAAPDAFTQGQFIYDYMGIANYYAQSYADDGNMGVPEMDVVPGNPVCSFTPIQWVYSTLWYADALELAPSAQGVYTMGPDGYVFDEYYSGLFNQYGTATILTFAFETARIDTEEHTDELFGQVIDFFTIFTGTGNDHSMAVVPSANVAPNPVSDRVTISATLAESSRVQLTLMDCNGRQVYHQDFGMQPQGVFNTEVSFKDLQLPGGLYAYMLNVNNVPLTGKIIKTK